MRDESLEYLKALANAPSPSGYELAAAKLFREYTQRYADRVSLDSHGNIIAALNPDAPMKIMLAAHMDEIGFVVHYIDEGGLLYFSAIGGHDSTIPPGQGLGIWH
ncbi:hypothetical protein MEX01_54530 [Methylorubrum extorquens]|nr:hypothetical protein [Methylorubrum extorquens]GEL44862.1 hypothetical protein MEX01_54530 [Methylorubrum extorquens]